MDGASTSALPCIGQGEVFGSRKQQRYANFCYKNKKSSTSSTTQSLDNLSNFELAMGSDLAAN